MPSKAADRSIDGAHIFIVLGSTPGIYAGKQEINREN